jgi:hypothetical protein
MRLLQRFHRNKIAGIELLITLARISINWPLALLKQTAKNVTFSQESRRRCGGFLSRVSFPSYMRLLQRLSRSGEDARERRGYFFAM